MGLVSEALLVPYDTHLNTGPPAQRSAPRVERIQSGGGGCSGVNRVAKCGLGRPNEPIEQALPSSGHVVYRPAPCPPWLGLG